MSLDGEYNEVNNLDGQWELLGMGQYFLRAENEYYCIGISRNGARHFGKAGRLLKNRLCAVHGWNAIFNHIIRVVENAMKSKTALFDFIG